MRYTKEEDKIILRNLKATSRVGAPLNIQAALADASAEIRKTLKRKRSQAALSVRWYKVLRPHHKVWGVGNMKNRTLKQAVATMVVTVGRRRFTMSANLRPQVIDHLKKLSK